MKRQFCLRFAWLVVLPVWLSLACAAEIPVEIFGFGSPSGQPTQKVRMSGRGLHHVIAVQFAPGIDASFTASADGTLLTVWGLRDRRERGQLRVGKGLTGAAGVAAGSVWRVPIDAGTARFIRTGTVLTLPPTPLPRRSHALPRSP